MVASSLYHARSSAVFTFSAQSVKIYALTLFQVVSNRAAKKISKTFATFARYPGSRSPVVRSVCEIRAVWTVWHSVWQWLLTARRCWVQFPRGEGLSVWPLHVLPESVWSGMFWLFPHSTTSRCSWPVALTEVWICYPNTAQCSLLCKCVKLVLNPKISQTNLKTYLELSSKLVWDLVWFRLPSVQLPSFDSNCTVIHGWSVGDAGEFDFAAFCKVLFLFSVRFVHCVSRCWKYRLFFILSWFHSSCVFFCPRLFWGIFVSLSSISVCCHLQKATVQCEMQRWITSQVH